MEDKRPNQEPENGTSYTPASPVKRTLAWIALAYVLIGLALTTFYFFNGYMLGNLGPLLTVRPRPHRPGRSGAGELALHRTAGKVPRHSAGYFMLGRRPGHPAHRDRGPAVQFWEVTG